MAKDLTSKQRVSRIPLDYHTRADSIRANRNVVTAVAAAGAIGLVAAIGLSRDWHSAAVSPGPVARVHTTWEQQCSACHESFTPIDSDAWLAKSPAGGAGPAAASAEFKCQTCHPGAPHHPQQIAAEAGSCTACHHEHRGREASLTGLDDRACTRCHAQIEQHVAADSGTPLSISGNVTSFPLDHPEFRSLEHDPTRLKFNHQRHLLPGLRSPEERQPAWTLADVAPDARARFRRSENDDRRPDEQIPVQIECGDCHRSAGAYMSPVKYEEHCRACHPLVYDRAGDNAVPHGLEQEALHQLLAGRFWERQVGERPERGSARPRIRPIPGQSSDRVDRETEATVARQVREAERHLQGLACAKCHDLQDPAERNGLVSVVPVEMPVVWMQRARFNHRAHRAVSCRECHAQAYADAPVPSTRTADVLIAGQAKCRECHAPSAASGQTASGHAGGADFRCVECHRYHRGDLSAAGRAVNLEQEPVGHLVTPLQKGDHARD